MKGSVSENPPVIKQDCSDLRSSHYALPHVELIVEVKSGPSGVDLRQFLVDYRAKGKEYTLYIPWENVACGTKIDRNWCS